MECDHQTAQIVESDGGTKEGRFVEHYECPCGATGTVRGEASAPPTEWRRTGEVFN
jgi:hypothetical protein